MRNVIKENKLVIFLFIPMILLGLGLLLYPFISNRISVGHYQKVIQTYDKKVSEETRDANNKLLMDAREYNRSLSFGEVVDVFQNPEVKNSDRYLSILNINDNGMMGYISIPKIDVRIPIYHGTTSDVLQKGVGHLDGSSFPVGGESTHAILSAHRGLPSSKLFTDLDQLKKGDIFYIYILNQVLAYQVDQVLVTEPSETDALRIVDGKDYITLVTCTPYAINTHRLLVRGERIEYNEQVEKDIEVDYALSTADIILYISLVIALLLIVVAIICFIKSRKNRQNPKDVETNSSDIEVI